MQNYVLRPLESQDREWVAALLIEHWGSETVVVHQTVYHPAHLPGFAALDAEARLHAMELQAIVEPFLDQGQEAAGGITAWSTPIPARSSPPSRFNWRNWPGLSRR